MYEWCATIEAWPHSSGEGADVDQAACGPRSAEFRFAAEDIEQALIFAGLIARGIEHNPRVWKAPIMSIVRVR